MDDEKLYRSSHQAKHDAEQDRTAELWVRHYAWHTSQEIAHDRDHDATDKAISKAETALEKRLFGMNEFRDALRDQASHFITRDMLETEQKANDRRLTMLEHNATTARGWVLGVGAAVGFLVITVNLVLRFV